MINFTVNYEYFDRGKMAYLRRNGTADLIGSIILKETIEKEY